MIKSFFKIVSIPFVYIILIILALLKWLIVAPILFLVYALKNIIIWCIIAVAVGLFATPIASVIIILIAIILSLSSSLSDMQEGFFGALIIPWEYAGNVFSANKVEAIIRKRKKLLKKSVKAYKRAKDEFAGFQSIADIYKK